MIRVHGTALPVHIKLDLLRGHRYSMNARSIRMRLPVTMTEKQLEDHLEACAVWVEDVLKQKPDLRAAYFGKTYQSGDVLTVGDRRYILDVEMHERVTNTARLIGDTISLTLNTQLGDWQRGRVVKTLLSRIVARDFQEEISRRVMDWNQRTFKMPIKTINLKYNHSNWGSCSSKGNVNLSTRLLFAPKSVQDYVILHELAHLVELNHSDRFWALVEMHMPDYQEKEKWLKKHRNECDF
ncbi:MAG: M48 family metallopeptidase [Bacteroidetes bacterium]|nr:M48 family metallopeptidase [Bacteroidota bacterium]